MQTGSVQLLPVNSAAAAAAAELSAGKGSPHHDTQVHELAAAKECLQQQQQQPHHQLAFAKADDAAAAADCVQDCQYQLQPEADVGDTAEHDLGGLDLVEPELAELAELAEFYLAELELAELVEAEFDLAALTALYLADLSLIERHPRESSPVVAELPGTWLCQDQSVDSTLQQHTALLLPLLQTDHVSSICLLASIHQHLTLVQRSDLTWDVSELSEPLMFLRFKIQRHLIQANNTSDV